MTPAQLIAAGVCPTAAKDFADPLTAAAALLGIDTPLRQAAWLAQLIVESRGFARLEEGLYYTTPERICLMWPSRVHSLGDAAKLCRQPQLLANTVYSLRNGNGDAASGDGWRYRGRGLIQITGRANYEGAQHDLGRPYLDQPELVAQPADACLTAASFWRTHHLNYLADASNTDAITLAINGPRMVAAGERRQAFDRALAALR